MIYSIFFQIALSEKRSLEQHLLSTRNRSTKNEIEKNIVDQSIQLMLISRYKMMPFRPDAAK